MRLIEIDSSEVTQRDPGPAPVLDWVPLDRCRINEAYQRPIEARGWATIAKIAADFSWARFGAIDVSRGPDGVFLIIDGQHRAHAARLAGITTVPALIKDLTEQQQAAAFAAINGTVTALTPLALFKAALAAREGWALRCAAVVADGGGQMMTGNWSAADKRPGMVFCIGAVRRLIDQGRAAALSASIGGLLRSGTHDDHRWFTAQPLTGLVQAVHDRGVTRADLLADFLRDVPLSRTARSVDLLKADRDGDYASVSWAVLFQGSVSVLLKDWLAKRLAEKVDA